MGRIDRGERDVTLANISGISRRHTGKIERGEQNATALNLLRLADAFNCKASKILQASGL
ncbi:MULTISPECIES: helix-turn-helix transcriptional regulator [unclassified Caballeronia]|uniref:helix-turn-helix transcriptional regulator n=1 Tax=unclassified Caballeronia TaxID=2646786 RepID=UPI0013EB0066|nr:MULTISPECIES: helix-turn-helix transcriptional regulator [unclassified Caballeronia]